jgi:LytS/YehU family sensor histidine kinase
MKASVYLSNFSDLVRNILEHSSRESIPLDKEISTIRNYFELQKVRFMDKFDYSISVDESIDIEVTEIPPMLAQPFIENAIEHGIRHRETPGHIWISYKKRPKGLEINIEDNGVGRARAKELEASEKENHLSVATNITRQRLSVLNKRSGRKIRMDILDLKADSGAATGTLVRFFIT